jgi:hypothetical protein
MKTQTLRRVRKMFSNPYIPAEHNRSYQRQWVRQVRQLGDKWLLATPVKKGGDRAAV